MGEYHISCPNCKKQFKLTFKDPKVLVQKSFICPGCKYSVPFVTLLKRLKDVQPVTIHEGSIPPPPQTGGNPQSSHSATKVAHTNAMNSPKASLMIIGRNERFVLNPGIYIMGRRSSDSTASLQIAPDISISRQHARLAIQMVGGKPMAQVVGLKAYNPVIVNGKILPAGQPYSLKNGDSIQLGQTKCIFSTT